MNPRAKLTSLLLIALASLPAACGDGDDTNYDRGLCLTDAQICSLQLGVTKQDDAIKAFGVPSDTSLGTSSTTSTASYVCVRLENNREAYSQGVSLSFDADELLTDVDVIRSGPHATPIPECVKHLHR